MTRKTPNTLPAPTRALRGARGAGIRHSGGSAAVARRIGAAKRDGRRRPGAARLRGPEQPSISNRAGEGFENKIAELLARELGWTLEYTWFPQRMGFIRNTLRGRDPDSNRFKCDLVLGVPVGFELASTTKPYYRSTYALVYAKGKGLDSVTVPEGLLRLDPAKLKSLKLGVFGQSPTADWLLKHRLFDQVVSYQPQSGDPERYPGEIIEKDLATGAIDVAFVWGPIAGYFAKSATSATWPSCRSRRTRRSSSTFASRWACASGSASGRTGWSG